MPGTITLFAGRRVDIVNDSINTIMCHIHQSSRIRDCIVLIEYIAIPDWIHAWQTVRRRRKVKQPRLAPMTSVSLCPCVSLLLSDMSDVCLLPVWLIFPVYAEHIRHTEAVLHRCLPSHLSSSLYKRVPISRHLHRPISISLKICSDIISCQAVLNWIFM